jgi:hypothetical protein
MSVVLPIFTLAIAGLAGVNSFFQWQTQWQNFRQTQLALEHLLSKWELEIVQAKAHSEGEAIGIAVRTTGMLIDLAREATVTLLEDLRPRLAHLSERELRPL